MGPFEVGTAIAVTVTVSRIGSLEAINKLQWERLHHLHGVVWLVTSIFQMEEIGLHIEIIVAAIDSSLNRVVYNIPYNYALWMAGDTTKHWGRLTRI